MIESNKFYNNNNFLVWFPTYCITNVILIAEFTLKLLRKDHYSNISVCHMTTEVQIHLYYTHQVFLRIPFPIMVKYRIHLQHILIFHRSVSSKVRAFWLAVRDHSFSTYAKFSEKKTFLTSLYSHAGVRIRG